VGDSSYPPVTFMHLTELRSLRARVRTLHRRVGEDLAPFCSSTTQTFVRLPDGDTSIVNVTTTCTATMALAAAHAADDVYGVGKGAGSLCEAFSRLMQAPWASSGLDPDNAFTSSMVLRTAGILVTHKVADLASLLAKKHARDPANKSSVRRNLSAIATDLAMTAPLSFAVVPGYQPAITLAYWVVDGADRLAIDLGTGWRTIADWAATTFSRQISLKASRHEALMDPVAMAMAACTLSRLRRCRGVAHAKGIPIDTIPTEIELRQGIRELFSVQGRSGIWPKYFPLFHYPDGGMNYTFSFELLEAVLAEFGKTPIVVEDDILTGLERAVLWCETNGLRFEGLKDVFRGWNSGGQARTLERGEPESWATATIHMFLRELENALTLAIDRSLLERYVPGAGRERLPSRKRWDRILDTEVQIGGQPQSVLGVIEREMIKALPPAKGTRVLMPRVRSALLFGPPGTSKTTLVRAFAERIGWPSIEIGPSHFLTRGLDGVYGRADEIFDDLYDLRQVVILFDEMDALVRRRPSDEKSPPLDIAREFLTTTMLPKLAELHDRDQSFYFMATNHREFFDDAVVRPGRFDLHLFMGMPSWKAKLDGLAAFLPGGTPVDEISEARDALSKWFPIGKPVSRDLEEFSYGELCALLDQFLSRRPVREAIRATDARSSFKSILKIHHSTLIALRPKRGGKPNPLRHEYFEDMQRSRIQ
jgi:hypothetical protein